MSAQPATSLYLLPSSSAAEWLTAEQVMTATGWSRRTFFRNVSGLIARDSDRTAPNGRKVREYLAASLPAEARGKIGVSGDGRKLQAGESAGGLIPNQSLLFTSLPSPTDEHRITLPDPEDQAQAEQRLGILKPILEFGDDPGRYASLRLKDGRPVTSPTRLLMYQAETHDIAERTLKTWIQRYRAGGFPALADKQRSDKNTSRWFAHNEKAAHLAAYLHLICQQSYRVCHEAIQQDAEMLGLGDDLPSYETVRAWLASAPPYLKAYAREGRRAYQERMSPYISRHYADVASNQIWVSDHMIHDVEVMNDCFPEAPYGTPIRLRFTCLLDFHSRYVVGASWCWEGSSRSIATALRRAALRHGACEHFYCDNGKDYRKVAKGAMPAYLAKTAVDEQEWWANETRWLDEIGILGRLQMKVTHCIVRHPQSKHVERFFRTLHERFDKQWFQNYTGGAPHLRPDATTAAMELHRKLVKQGRANESFHPPASYFIAACMAWIDEYHHRVHEGEGMDGRTPAQVFEQDRLDESRPMPSERDLALLLAEQTRRKVRECSIELNKRRYTYYDAESRDVLHEMNERDVLVAYDPNDTEGVAILDQDGHFLCWAREEQMLGFNPADPEIQQQIGQSMADRRHLEKSARNLLEGIARTARSNGARTPVEMLAERTKVSPIVEATLTHRAPKLKPDPEAAAPPSAADIAQNFLEALK
ncbi:Mu transposase C-terminal domain-containing protein [Alloacidobacterium dinghuense]|uniref:Mu transposase C-terminal domain-containing protein n=1 Tax=Alloacidobacterium dinghuense TaxID=2763107 RepID=A0A7G8BPP2_9BACT|nr:Mu transposase C-terminal domain-containing protein [Alloacidobacterium dinghuense]QNI34512.1 Mu transposase C-terminal domain-containing protein [Alloacidobacterium dinghuense]